MAEAILKDLVQKKEKSEKFVIDSAALSMNFMTHAL